MMFTIFGEEKAEQTTKKVVQHYKKNTTKAIHMVFKILFQETI